MELCVKCKEKERAKNKKYCKDCHNAYMREWRKNNPLSEDQKKRDRCRSYASVYLKRGKIEKRTCIICGSPNSEMHHKDYNKPLEVIWLCRSCHNNQHKEHKC